ncbi:MAG TPA: hypothetical protein VKW06_21440 [Candidatus Angelobacter sp.]|nr:hypothetical protein [Candidatus Angelobacter sp.]
MQSIPQGTTMVEVQMDRILESAVVLSWKDLLHPSQRGPIHIEYAPGTRLPYLKIWQLTGRGEWSLVCEYWMSRGLTDDGMTFSNDYHSAGLAHMLGVIMQHQDSFAPSLKPGAGLILVTLPTEQENSMSGACMKHVYESLGLCFAHIPAAAAA